MFFLLAFGCSALVAAARFARAPSTRRFRVSVGLSLATLLTTATATCADLAAVGHHARDYLLAHPNSTMPNILLQGFAESMSPSILGFSMLSIVALLVVLGFVRDPNL